MSSDVDVSYTSGGGIEIKIQHSTSFRVLLPILANCSMLQVGRSRPRCSDIGFGRAVIVLIVVVAMMSLEVGMTVTMLASH